MSNFVFDSALGRVVELVRNVKNGSPTNSRLVLLAFNTAAADSTLRSLTTVTAIESDADTDETTSSGTRKVIGASDITITVDNTNHRVDIDVVDQTWETPEAGDEWTDLCLAYDPDNSSGDDSDLIPLLWFDFGVTPDGGSDIVAQVNAAGVFRAVSS